MKKEKEVSNYVEEEIAGTNTGSVPNTSNMGPYKKRDKRRKDDVEHMYRRNLLAKATEILKKLKKKKRSKK